jgi:hypothetical protein
MKRIALGLAALALIGSTPDTVKAGMMLTPAGRAEGFLLSTFAGGFPFDGPTAAGPLGIAFTPGGGIMVSDFPGNVRIFPTDTDGQNAPAAPVAQNYGRSNAVGLAQAGGKYYLTRQADGDLVQLNADGTFGGVLASGMPSATGVAVNPGNGHLFVGTVLNDQIFDVDPVAHTKTLFARAKADGLAVNSTGTILYAALRGGYDEHVVGFDIPTGAAVFDSGAIAGQVDGITIGSGLLGNNLYVNTNAGTLLQISLATLAVTTIASGGSRGDFVTVDPNGTLLVTQTDSVLRLSFPPGSGPGGGPVTPQPSGLALLSVGLACLAIYGWLRRATGACSIIVPASGMWREGPSHIRGGCLSGGLPARAVPTGTANHRGESV